MNQQVLLRNNVIITGKGNQAILFAPGFGCDQNMWRLVAPAFEEKYRVILFDYVGSGKSDYSAYNSSKYSDLNGYVQDVLEICEGLELKKNPFLLDIRLAVSLECLHLSKSLTVLNVLL